MILFLIRTVCIVAAVSTVSLLVSGLDLPAGDVTSTPTPIVVILPSNFSMIPPIATPLSPSPPTHSPPPPAHSPPSAHSPQLPSPPLNVTKLPLPSLNISMSENATLTEMPESNGGNQAKSNQVGTSAFLMATLPMLALVGAFFAQCKKGDGHEQQIPHSKLSTAAQEEEESMNSAEDKESDSDLKDPLFVHRTYQPQNHRAGDGSKSFEEDIDNSSDTSGRYSNMSMRV